MVNQLIKIAIDPDTRFRHAPTHNVENNCISGAETWPRRRLAVMLTLVGALGLSACDTLQDLGLEQKAPTASVAAPEPPEEAAPKVSSFEATVKDVQKHLNELGYEAGPIDGLIGPQTRAAIRDYQADQGLSPDGQVSYALVEQIEASLATLETEATPRKGETATIQPMYEAGDIYAYSNGMIEKIVAVDGEIVIRETNRGVHTVSHRNFILPAISWRSSSRSVRSAIDTPADALWPNIFGEEIYFATHTRMRAANRPDQETNFIEKWRCMLTGTETVSVAAGTFDSLRIVCRLLNQSARLPKEQVWFFAPEVGHYVRRDDLYGSSELNKRTELVAIRPGTTGWPPAARAGLGWARQHSLEALASGEITDWQSSGVDARVSIKPAAKFRRDDGTYCRNFVEALTKDSIKRNYPGLACRQSTGDWLIPGFETSGNVDSEPNEDLKSVSESDDGTPRS